jgi:exonuclease VII small subunit
MAEEVSVDVLLDRLEAITARLGTAGEPIEELVVAYETGLKLAEAARLRLDALGEKAAATD